MADIILGKVVGDKGDAATVSVGTVTTGPAGSSAVVTNSGTVNDAVLNFTIPKGDKGDPGTPGVSDFATTSAAGLVRVGDDFNINASTGVLSIKDAFTEASTLANITSGESHATILGKIRKFMTTLMPSNFLINTVNSTSAEKALTANMGHTIAGDLATVQTTNKASKAYSVGEYLVLNGLLYKVTAAIANGGTITPGTNVTATTAGAQLKSLNDSLATLTFAYSSHTPVITGTPTGEVVTATWTADEDCFIMASLATGSTTAGLFARINIAGFSIFQENGAVRNYQYLTTPIYRVPKNAVITFAYQAPATGSAVLYKFT